MNLRLILGTLMLAVCGLVACSSTSSGSSPSAVTCNLPSGVQVALAYPISGATSVPDAPGLVILAVSSPLPSTWQTVATLTGGSSPTFEGFVTTSASPFPTPFATPSFANPSFQTSGLNAGFASGANIAISLNNSAAGCNNFPVVGTFTTQ